MKVFDLLESVYTYVIHKSGDSANVHYVLGQICHPLMIINIDLADKSEYNLVELYK
jgi:hypothetical protein